MVKTDWGRLLAQGAGAVAVPVLVEKSAQLTEFLAKVPMLDTELAGITVGGWLLATAGIYGVNALFYK